MMREIELRPCPFCGGAARMSEHVFHALKISYGVACTECKTQGWQFCGTPEEAAARWNKRTGKGEEQK